jgi:hypothetical protein
MANWRQPHGGNTAGAQSMNRQPMSKFMKGNLAFAAVEVPMNMAAGDDFGTAALKAGAGAALWATAPWVMGAHLAATTIPQGLAAAHQWKRQKVNQWNMQHMQGAIGSNYQDTQRAFTMRQAAVQVIQGSKMNARSALGGEARILAKSWHK